MKSIEMTTLKNDIFVNSDISRCLVIINFVCNYVAKYFACIVCKCSSFLCVI